MDDDGMDIPTLMMVENRHDVCTSPGAHGGMFARGVTGRQARWTGRPRRFKTVKRGGCQDQGMTDFSRSTEVLRSLYIALAALPSVDRVMISCEHGLRFLRVAVDNRHHVVAVLYRVAEVVVPVDDGRIARPLHALTNDAVCDVARAFGMTLIHGVYNPGRPGGVPMAARNRRLPDQLSLVRERNLTAATMGVDVAHARRLMAEAAGMVVPTGVALLSGAPLDIKTLTFPLIDAETREYERLYGREDLPF